MPVIKWRNTAALDSYKKCRWLAKQIIFQFTHLLNQLVCFSICTIGTIIAALVSYVWIHVSICNWNAINECFAAVTLVKKKKATQWQINILFVTLFDLFHFVVCMRLVHCCFFFSSSKRITRNWMGKCNRNVCILMCCWLSVEQSKHRDCVLLLSICYSCLVRYAHRIFLWRWWISIWFYEHNRLTIFSKRQ